MQSTSFKRVLLFCYLCHMWSVVDFSSETKKPVRQTNQWYHRANTESEIKMPRGFPRPFTHGGGQVQGDKALMGGGTKR